MKRSVIHRGFTLVELIVVIAIILVLMALTLGVIQRAMVALEDAKASREIKLLDQACEQFKATFNHYPPGRIMLCEDMRGYYAAINDHLCQMHFQHDVTHQRALAYLASKSIEFLQAIFPGIDLNAGHDWNGDGVIDDRQYYLTGDEALVFFLGGMRYGKGAVDPRGSNRTGPLGFNTDKTNPTRRTTGARLGPYFEFDESRIVYPVCVPNLVWPIFLATPPRAGTGEEYSFEQYWNVGCSSGLVGRSDEQFTGFFSRYHDLWGTPYVYFRARMGQANNFAHLYSPYCFQMDFKTNYYVNYHCWFADNYYLEHKWVELPVGLGRNGMKMGKRLNPEDNTLSSSWIEIVPYIRSYDDGKVTYYNPNRFQIISAGRDKKFGSGGYYNKESSQAELSQFKNYRYFQVENIPMTEEYKANHDNITNVNFDRVVPRP